METIEVLVVDYNISDIFLIRQALTEEPYPIDIRVAPSGHRACQMLAAKRCQPDLVILGLNLRSCLAVFDAIDPGVPVVMFTSAAVADDRRLAFELGVEDYVQKPSHPSEFVDAVSRMCGNGRRCRCMIGTVHDEINPDARVRSGKYLYETYRSLVGRG